MLESFKAKFGLCLDDKQLKNKITTMVSCWESAHKLYNQTGNGDTPKATLKERILKICHYYDILYPVATTSIKLNPPPVCELTTNLCSKRTVAVGDTDDDRESDKDDDEYINEGKPWASNK
ncbi:hypothetical protein BX616_001206 [Lobosporangium transversale]|nr:hypothetical protein BX616_001206 [Lobosporangium transversale]